MYSQEEEEEKKFQTAMAQNGAVAAAEERRRRASVTPTVRRRPVALSTEQRHQAEIAHFQEVIDRLEAKIEKLSESLSAARSQRQPVVLPRTLLCGVSYHTTIPRPEDVARIAALEAELVDRNAIIDALLVDAAPQQSTRPSASARPAAAKSNIRHFTSEASYYSAEESIEVTRETTIRVGGVISSTTSVRRFP